MSPIISEMVSSEARSRAAYPSRRDLIRCIAALGRWATSSAQLQVNERTNSASIGFIHDRSPHLAVICLSWIRQTRDCCS